MGKPPRASAPLGAAGRNALVRVGLRAGVRVRAGVGVRVRVRVRARVRVGVGVGVRARLAQQPRRCPALNV